jgi:hypothetical protein
MEPAKYDLPAKAGTTYRKSFNFMDAEEVALDFTGYTARMQLRLALDSVDPALELTTENGRISIEDGTVSLYIEDDQTTLLAPDFVKVNYVYDIELVAPSGDIVSPLYGKFIVSPEVTR